MFGRWREFRERRRQEQQESAEKATRTAARHTEDLAKFMHGLVPGDQHSDDQTWLDARGVMNIGDPRADWCKQLAEGPLWHDHEAVARKLVRLRPSGNKRATWFESTAVRTIGEQLCAEGGRFLMVLVAHRAQYLADPMWQAKAEARFNKLQELRAKGINIISVDVFEGPLVRELEYGWDGICGWQH